LAAFGAPIRDPSRFSKQFLHALRWIEAKRRGRSGRLRNTTNAYATKEKAQKIGAAS
jgi:hypothetical protein